MKNAALLLLIILLLGCRKEGLDVKFKTIYSSSGSVLNKNDKFQYSNAANYPQFGNLVGEITPSKVTAKFHSIRYIDKKSTTGMQTMVELISTNWADDDPRRLADFTGGNSVEVTPEMWGNIDNDGWFVEDNIKLKYLGIFPQNFEFEFDLPSQYQNNPLFLDNKIPNLVSRDGNKIKCQIHFLLWPITGQGFDYQNGRMLNGYVFGETTTTYIQCQDNISSDDVAELISMAQPHCVARSGNYVSPTLTPPMHGEVKYVTTKINFNTSNIIQQYAGFDNTAYTNDDIFVLRPQFWDRFNITIDQN